MEFIKVIGCLLFGLIVIGGIAFSGWAVLEIDSNGNDKTEFMVSAILLISAWLALSYGLYAA